MGSDEKFTLTWNRYMYSLVFAADMYKTVFKQDPLDPALGAKYRKEILLPGGSREETESLEVRPTYLNLPRKGPHPVFCLEIPWAAAKFRCFPRGTLWQVVIASEVKDVTRRKYNVMSYA